MNLLKILCIVLAISCLSMNAEAKSVPEKHKSTPEGRKRKSRLAATKALHILSFLNYSDRNVDRPLVGPVAFNPYKGKHIRHIEVKVMYPYGVNLDSPEVYHPTKFQKFANKIQFRTRQWVILNELLFKEGDAVDPILFSDSQRNLWTKNIYKDIKFILTNADNGDVDVTVYIRDKWNWSVTSSLDYDKVTPGIQFNNVFGLPQVINAGVSINYRADNIYTVNASYRYSNIKSSFVDASLNMTYDRFKQGGGLEIVRNFYSAKAEWAGHIKAYIINQSFIAPSLSSNPILAPNLSNIQDIWLARAFKMPFKFYEKSPLLRLIVSSRMMRTAYMSRPYLHNPDRSINFINSTILLGGIGFARWDYYIDHNVYELGRAEYFTKGLSASLLVGFQEDEELSRRTYVGASLQYGRYFNNGGYLLSQFKYGGFATDRSYDQVLIDWQNTFYTLPHKLGKATSRHFINTNMKLGFSRPAGREIVANNTNGLRGLYSNELRGNRTFGLGYEIDFYAQKRVAGFASCMFLFTDAILIQKTFNDNKVQTAVGFGFRLRNLNFGIDFIEILFAYYPKLQVADQQPYNYLGNFKNDRSPEKRDLFTPNILSVD